MPSRADGVLFSESQGRMIVSVSADAVDALASRADEHGVPMSRIGVTGGDKLEIQVNGAKAVSLEVAALRDLWWNAIEQGLTK